MSTDSVGPLLKQARETHGLSLDQVASVTRIQLKYLQALEEEHFAALPEPVFTKGFVRAYARALGLDEQDVLRRFSEASTVYYGRGQPEPERVQVDIEEEKPRNRNRTAIVILIGVMVLGLGLYLSGQRQPAPSPTPETIVSPSVSSPTPTEEITETPQVIEPASVQPLDSESNTVPAEPELPRVALPSGAAQPIPVNPKNPEVSPIPGLLLMELEATQLTWVVVKSDEKEPEEALLQPNQRTTWKAHEQFTLTLGNAGGVRIWLNGESRGPFGKHGQIVREVVLRD